MHLNSCIGVRARGLGGCSPQVGQIHYFSGKGKIFRAEASSQKLFIKLKTEFIPSSKMKCQKSRIFTNNYWVSMAK